MNLEKLKFWRRFKSKQVIKHDCYEKLPLSQRQHFYQVDEPATHEVVESGGDFILSAIIGYESDSALTGAAMGGDLLGGIVGESLADSNDQPADNTDYSSSDNGSSFSGFGGGDFGGDGASGSYGDSSSDSSSYDSGSSYDSSDSSSYDSSSSSSDY